MKWTWKPEGVLSVTSPEGKTADYKLSEDIKRLEVVEFSVRLMKAALVFRTLRTAIQSFASGQASYHGAMENLTELVDAADEAEALFQSSASGIDGFFDPPGLSKGFQAEELLQMASNIQSSLMEKKE